MGQDGSVLLPPVHSSAQTVLTAATGSCVLTGATAASLVCDPALSYANQPLGAWDSTTQTCTAKRSTLDEAACFVFKQQRKPMCLPLHFDFVFRTIVHTASLRLSINPGWLSILPGRLSPQPQVLRLQVITDCSWRSQLRDIHLVSVIVSKGDETKIASTMITGIEDRVKKEIYRIQALCLEIEAQVSAVQWIEIEPQRRLVQSAKSHSSIFVASNNLSIMGQDGSVLLPPVHSSAQTVLTAATGSCVLTGATAASLVCDPALSYANQPLGAWNSTTQTCTAKRSTLDEAACVGLR
ncbi:hypothetical protein As57867_015054, partial [Aphanomyces stellatus]